MVEMYERWAKFQTRIEPSREEDSRNSWSIGEASIDVIESLWDLKEWTFKLDKGYGLQML